MIHGLRVWIDASPKRFGSGRGITQLLGVGEP